MSRLRVEKYERQTQGERVDGRAYPNIVKMEHNILNMPIDGIILVIKNTRGGADHGPCTPYSQENFGLLGLKLVKWCCVGKDVVQLKRPVDCTRQMAPNTSCFTMQVQNWGSTSTKCHINVSSVSKMHELTL